MFATLRNLASRFTAIFTGTTPTIDWNRYQGPPVPLRRTAPAAWTPVHHANGGKHPRTKGQKSRSQKARSTRRKAAAKAHAR